MSIRNLHPDDEALFWRVHSLAFKLARMYRLPLEQVEPKRRPLAGSAFGLCYISDRRISIAFRWKNRAGDGEQWWKKPLPEREVLDTMAHELAHLRYSGENAEHRAFAAQLLAAAYIELNCYADAA